MTPVVNLLPKAWWACELPGYRDHPEVTTYSRFEYDALPPVEAPADFNWLRTEPRRNASLADAFYPDGTAPDLSYLPRLVAQMDAEPPPEFMAFMQASELQTRVRSCTACFLELPDLMVDTFGKERGHLLHFLSDQQWVLHWYLYLNREGQHCILVSDEAYGFDLDEPLDALELNLRYENIWFCAPSFQEFIYRFWLENEIWYSLAWDRRPLTPQQQAYVDHYRPV